MIAYLIETALRLRWVVLLLVVALMALGVWVFFHQQIDAYPDISSQMVQVITTYPGRAPEDVERQVTIPIENAMLGTPKVEEVRSRTIFGLSVVQMMFEEGTEELAGLASALESLGQAGLARWRESFSQLGALDTAYGEIYRYQLVSEAEHSTVDRVADDQRLGRRPSLLLSVPGVAEANNMGGYVKLGTPSRFIRPNWLQHSLALSDDRGCDHEEQLKAVGAATSSPAATRRSSFNGGGGLLENTRQIENIFVKSVGGTPVYLKDVASVGIDTLTPNGIFGKDFTDSAVEGIVVMRKGENPSEVLRAVQDAVKELNETALPTGVRIVPYYDRSAS